VGRQSLVLTAFSFRQNHSLVVLTSRLFYLFDAHLTNNYPLLTYIELRMDKALRIAVNAAGIPPANLHDLRRTYASRAVNAKVPFTAISRQLGHRQHRDA
jgi:integrase